MKNFTKNSITLTAAALIFGATTLSAEEDVLPNFDRPTMTIIEKKTYIPVPLINKVIKDINKLKIYEIDNLLVLVQEIRERKIYNKERGEEVCPNGEKCFYPEDLNK